MRSAPLLALLAIGLFGCDAAEPDAPPPPLASACVEPMDWQASAYVLPYAPGRAHFVIQGNCGSFSHRGAAAYAYDFRMPIGTPVTAVRGGVVFRADDPYLDSDRDPDHANRVTVEHDDGTFGRYLHLTQGGALVEVGDRVEAGDVLGLSGNSGFSTEPHLHFDLLVDCGDENQTCVTAPVTFRNTSHNPRGLLQGRVYVADAFGRSAQAL